MSELLEIIDTTIKIGLGAAISGLTVYFTTRKSHRHEMKINKVNVKKEMIQKCVSNINTSTSLVTGALQNIYSICHSQDSFSIVHFNEEFEKMMNGLGHAREAMSLAYLANEKELGELISQVIDLIIERAYHIQDNKSNYSIKFINSKNEQASEIGQKILSHYGGIFERMYSINLS